jgi:hypothetical protein
VIYRTPNYTNCTARAGNMTAEFQHCKIWAETPNAIELVKLHCFECHRRWTEHTLRIRHHDPNRTRSNCGTNWHDDTASRHHPQTYRRLLGRTTDISVTQGQLQCWTAAIWSVTADVCDAHCLNGVAQSGEFTTAQTSPLKNVPWRLEYTQNFVLKFPRHVSNLCTLYSRHPVATIAI